MAKVKKAVDHLTDKKEIKVELIPVYVSEQEFLEKKAEIQKLLAKILISAHKRGRPSKKDEKDVDYAA